MIKELKEHQDTIHRERTDAMRHYNNAAMKGNDAKAEKWKKVVAAHDYTLRNLNSELFKLENTIVYTEKGFSRDDLKLAFNVFRYKSFPHNAPTFEDWYSSNFK